MESGSHPNVPPRRRLDGSPALVTREHRCVPVGVHGRGDRGAHHIDDLLVARPKVGEGDVRSVGGLRDGFGERIEVHGPGQGVRHHERRRGEVVEADLVVHPPFEVAVAGKHGRNRQGTLFHRLRHTRQQRSGVADASRASESDKIKTKCLERLEQIRALKVVHDDARPGCERCLHPRLLSDSELHSLAGDKAGTYENVRVRRVGTARDCSDHDAAVGELCGRAIFERGGRRAAAGAGVRRAVARAERRVEALLRADSGTWSCGLAGPARLGTTVDRSSSSVSAKTGSISDAHIPCSFAYASTRAT